METHLYGEQRAEKAHKPGLGAVVLFLPLKSKITGIWKGGTQVMNEIWISGWGKWAEGWGLLEGEPSLPGSTAA